MKLSTLSEILLAALVTLAVCNLVYAESVTIDFQDLPTGYLSGDEYASLGVLFSAEEESEGYVGDAYIWHGGGWIAGGPAGLEYIDVVATFIDPSTGSPATTTFVEVVAWSGPGGDTLSDNVALLGYNVSGQLVASDPADPSLESETLRIDAPGIAKVVMVAGSKLDIFDDFTYEGDLQSSPWGCPAQAEASVHGTHLPRLPAILNHLIVAFVPFGFIFFLRILRRKR